MVVLVFFYKIMGTTIIEWLFYLLTMISIDCRIQITGIVTARSKYDWFDSLIFLLSKAEHRAFFLLSFVLNYSNNYTRFMALSVVVRCRRFTVWLQEKPRSVTKRCSTWFWIMSLSAQSQSRLILRRLWKMWSNGNFLRRISLSAFFTSNKLCGEKSPSVLSAIELFK